MEELDEMSQITIPQRDQTSTAIKMLKFDKAVENVGIFA